MSEQEWAAIVYGRSYHLDFRLITIPHNFTHADTQWASQHIVATTVRARNLTGCPRWSIFKNDSYCVLGVTCMVRDLINQLSEDLRETRERDDQGRPLYVFVGYVTKLSQQKIHNFPDYQPESLDDFKSLYQEIEKVWLVKNYDLDSRNPTLSQYQPRNFAQGAIAHQTHQIPQLNDLTQHPDKIYLYPSSRQQNSSLWLTSVQCSQPTSTCLNLKGKILVNSPFLNQTSSQIEQFEITERVANQGQHSSDPENIDYQTHSSLSQRISHRAKDDIDLTLQQAAKLATAGQVLIDSFNNWSNDDQTNSPQSANHSDEPESFGFKAKKTDSTQQDWF